MLFGDGLRKSVEKHLGAYLKQHGFTLRSYIAISNFPFSRVIYVSDKYWIEIYYERGPVGCIIGSTQFQIPDSYFYEGSDKSLDRTKFQVDFEDVAFLWQHLENLKLIPIVSDPFSYSRGSIDAQVRRLANAIIEHGDAIFDEDVLVGQIESLRDYRRQRAEDLQRDWGAEYEARQAAGKVSQPRQMSLPDRLFIGFLAFIVLASVLMFISMIGLHVYYQLR